MIRVVGFELCQQVPILICQIGVLFSGDLDMTDGCGEIRFTGEEQLQQQLVPLGALGRRIDEPACQDIAAGVGDTVFPARPPFAVVSVGRRHPVEGLHPFKLRIDLAKALAPEVPHALFDSFLELIARHRVPREQSQKGEGR